MQSNLSSVHAGRSPLPWCMAAASSGLSSVPVPLCIRMGWPGPHRDTHSRYQSQSSPLLVSDAALKTLRLSSLRPTL
ncbi:hypothetical protein EX30DRAFT_122479 [Ascodesmis nigricans]|uniref:Uncharacterized protein n=1 Tax=Ascodesmis nigricans TaxID=341454 RepID=A0A4S2MRY0_9PEZI|nr:hypothetical protein EX30DRAFT_122479 [Ascodesmis nigricans]